MATYTPKRKTATSGTTETIKFPIASIDGLQTALDAKLPLAGGSMNNNASIKLTKYGNRYITIDGNSIAVDMSNCTGGWAGNFASVKDPSGTTTAMLGWYGGASGLTHIFMGGTYSDPALKMTPAGEFTFKTAPYIGSEMVATLTELDVLEEGLTQDLSDLKFDILDGKLAAGIAIADASGREITETYATNTSVSNTYAKKDKGIYYIEGTGSTAGTWLGSHDDISEYYAGLTVAYKIGIAGASSTTLNINSLGAVKVVRAATSAVTTHYPVNGIVILVYTVDSSGTAYWKLAEYDSNTVPAAHCETGASTAAKTATYSNFTLTSKSYIYVNMRYANTKASALTLNINSKGAKPIYINGEASSSSNYSLPAGSYIVYYDGTNFYFRTDGKLTASITGSAGNGLEMPQIRFTNVSYADNTQIISETKSMTLTVEIVGGGALQVGDKLQICFRRKYGKLAADGETKYGKWRLRKKFEYEITEDDLGKQFLSISVDASNYAIGDKHPFFLKDMRGGCSTLSPFYMRIKRVTNYGADGVENNAIFSNVLTLWKTYHSDTGYIAIK